MNTSTIEIILDLLSINIYFNNHQLPFAKKVRYYEREMKLIFDKWNLEKIKKITNL